MNKILEKKVWWKDTPAIKEFVVEAPWIAEKHKAGQFVILRVSENGERIPLTISNKNLEKGTINILFQEVGKTTMTLGKLNVGDNIFDLAGPLGKPTHIEKFGTVVCVGGGIGIAPVHPIAQAMKAAGNHVIGILAARNCELLFFREEMRRAWRDVRVFTDDGSEGKKGLATDAIRELVQQGRTIDKVIAIGPLPMM